MEKQIRKTFRAIPKKKRSVKKKGSAKKRGERVLNEYPKKLNSKRYEKMEKKELKRLIKMAKKILEKKILKKIKLVKDVGESLNALRYSLKSALDLSIYGLEKDIKKMKRKKKDVFFAETKLSMLRNKVKLFNAIHHKKDFDFVLSLTKEIKREVKNV